MKALFLILTILLLFACQKRENLTIEFNWILPVFEYYENGSIKSIHESNGEHGKTVEYYPSGNIKTQSNWVNDTTMVSVHYYETGIIEETSRWRDGKLCGDYVKYDETGNLVEQKTFLFNKQDGFEKRYDKGNFYQLRQYLLVNDSSYLNQIINFDNFGNIQKESSRYYTIHYDSKTCEIMELNKSTNVLLSLSPTSVLGSAHHIQNVRGNFDNSFNIIDPQSLDTVFMNNIHEFIDSYSFDTLGEQWVNGIILSSYKDKDNNIKHEKMYYTIPFYVNDK